MNTPFYEYAIYSKYIYWEAIIIIISIIKIDICI